MWLSLVFCAGKTKPSNEIRFDMRIGWVKNPTSMEANKKGKAGAPSQPVI